jgi:beta-glucosidase
MYFPSAPLQAIRALAPNASVTFVDGTNPEAAAAAAKAADVAIVFATQWASESIDVPMALDGNQDALIDAVASANPKTAVVLETNAGVAMPWAARVPAIVEAWYPGVDGGHAVAQLLAGDFSPAGRLPVTFYRSADQLPAFNDYSMANRTYRYFKGDVLYPFGHGLSYTSFRYSKPRLSASSVKAGNKLTVSVDVTNTGARDSDEVVQLYLSHPGVVGAPTRALEGFKRVHVKRGETKTVALTLDERAMSVVDPRGTRRIIPGKVDVWVGGGQPVARPGLDMAAGANASFRLTGSKILPK